MSGEKILGGIKYECIRCGAITSSEELAKLPEIICPHGCSRILKKVRPPIVKQIKAL
ncbi:hypothetical protein HRbin06_00506 [archaeon HR06]|nr:hypothetical protein HRbin06_00506 [archaeon HR06]